MEPFTIQCTTCQSKIRVRNASLIGQLANCPKCSAMMLVSPPGSDSTTSHDGSSVDSTAVTRAGLPSEVLPETATHHEPDSAHTAGDSAEDGYRLAPVAEQSTTDERPTGKVAADSVELERWAPDDSPLLPSEQWTSADASRKRQYLLVSFIGLISITLAAGGFFAFTNWYRKQRGDAEATEIAITTGGPSEPQANQDDENAATTGDVPNNAAEDRTSADEVAADADEKLQPSADELSNEPAATTETHAATDTSLTPDGALAVESALLPPSAADALLPADTPATDQPAESAGSENLTVPKQLRELEQVMQYDLQPTIPDEGVIPTEAPVTAAELGLEVVLNKPSIQPVNWRSRAEVQLPGIAVQGPPPSLATAVNLWVSITGVPTRVDFDSFAAAGIDRNRPAPLPQIREQSMSIGQAAQSFASQLGASLEVRENRYLELVAPTEVVLSNLPTSLPLEGLLAANQQQSMVSQLARLINAPEDSLTLQAGQLAPAAQSIRPAQWLALVRIWADWRRAAGVNVPAVKLPGQLTMNFVQPSDIKTLDRPLELVSPQSRPVGQVLTKACREAGLECWIDWPNVGKFGLGPSTLDVVLTRHRPLRQVLSDYADRYNLVVALLDDRSLWVTTAEAHRRQVQLYAVAAAGKTSEQWKRDLRDLTPLSEDGIGEVQIVATPDKSFMLLRCCRPILRL